MPTSSHDDFAGVIERMTEAIAHNPEDSDAFFRRGNAYSNSAYYPQARDDMERVIELDPANAMAHNNLGVANLCLGDFQTAVRNTTRAAELDPAYRDAHHNLGLAHSEIGELELALADFSRAIELDRSYWPAYRHRSVVHHLLGNADTSYRDFLRARELEQSAFS